MGTARRPDAGHSAKEAQGVMSRGRELEGCAEELESWGVNQPQTLP